MSIVGRGLNNRIGGPRMWFRGAAGRSVPLAAGFTGPALLLSANSIVENSTQGTAIGVATPINASNPGAVSIASQEVANLFQMNVDGATLEVGSGAAGLDYETRTSATVTLEFTDDNGTYQFPRTIQITDAPAIQITTPGSLDPALLLVGNQIGDAYTPGTYPDYNGNSVSEAPDYQVDSASELSTYVLQSGDLVGQVEITASATGADDLVYFSAIEGITDYTFTPTDLEWVVPSSGGSAPAQFGSGDWSVADDGTNGDVTITITTLPSDGGSAITDLEYQIDGGAWVSLAATSTGTYGVSGLTDGTAYDFSVRAVNANGNGTAAATKSVTPTGVPAAFTAGQWSIADDTTGGDATITITALPSANGSAITDLERKIGAGAWTSLGAATTGTYPLANLFTDGVATDVLIRAVNANGNGPDSDTKSVTTTTASSGPTLQSQGRLINTSAVGTTPAILTSVTMTAGDMLVIVMDTCRNTGGSAMTISGSWNGEALAESSNILHSGGRITSHILTLVAASSGTFSPVITCSNSAAAVGAYFYVVRGQSGSPIKQTITDALTSSSGPITALITAPNSGALVFATGSIRFATGGASTMTANSPLAHDDTFQTGTGNNLDLAFGAGHMTAPSTSNITLSFTPNASQNLLIAGIEIF